MCEITSFFGKDKRRVGRMGIGEERSEVGQVSSNLISGTFSFFCFATSESCSCSGLSPERC